MKLWDKKGITATERVEQFTVGNDRTFDLKLARFDVIGSLAHTEMLQQIGLLHADEWAKIKTGLNEILAQIDAGNFVIDPTAEDIHSQIEFALTQRIGDAGKRIHSGRSRNDQVLLDIKLFLKSEWKTLSQLVKSLFDLLIQLSEAHQQKLLPGYTHLQLAMPSSFGLWFGAYAESLTEDLEFVKAAYTLCDRNPLGSGAGYGSSFPLNREFTTERLGFGELNVNSVYAQMTRGKTEKASAMAMSMLAGTLSKLAYDCCLYLNPHFGFISFPDQLTTGSSIMPHKKNPDVFELIRARCNRIQALPNELTLLTNNLPSGYHRDFQLTKEILFPALEELRSCIELSIYMLERIEVKDQLLNDPAYQSLFSVEAVNKLVMEGTPFREAYQLVGAQIANGTFTPPRELDHRHTGSIGNPGTALIQQRMLRFADLWEE